MNTAISEVRSLLERLPEDSTYEDIQYHLYVVEKIQRGLARAGIEGTLSVVAVIHGKRLIENIPNRLEP